ncbi:hypothetical protein POTOM_016520 [Populus tomentosa]|uniref:DOCKER domain-containing protein n=1 Tax=Populus tomentosa TaxID=118781 RepID=A0A8X8A958_POPTO|nr:hypothetical protein POTOM_016520 [Populus tomentosa]
MSQFWSKNQARFHSLMPHIKGWDSVIGRSVEEEVWSVLQTEGSFPTLVNRLLEPRSSEGDQLPRLQSLQRVLQGSVAVQVNSGVLSVCTAFLSSEPAARLSSQELQQLIAALLEFMVVCKYKESNHSPTNHSVNSITHNTQRSKRAIRVHFRLIGEEGQDFHTQLVNGFQSLTAELSHYIPAILAAL